MLCSWRRIQIRQKNTINKATGHSILIPHRCNGEAWVFVVLESVKVGLRNTGMEIIPPRCWKSGSPILQVSVYLEENWHSIIKIEGPLLGHSSSKICQPD